MTIGHSAASDGVMIELFYDNPSWDPTHPISSLKKVLKRRDIKYVKNLDNITVWGVYVRI